jgi:hypothetical protein
MGKLDRIYAKLPTFMEYIGTGCALEGIIKNMQQAIFSAKTSVLANGRLINTAN